MSCSVPMELFNPCESPDPFCNVPDVIISHSPLWSCEKRSLIGVWPVIVDIFLYIIHNFVGKPYYALCPPFSDLILIPVSGISERLICTISPILAPPKKTM